MSVKQIDYTIFSGVVKALLVLCIILIPNDIYAAQTARQQLDTSVNKYLRSGTTVSFSYSGVIGKGVGTLKSKGGKFALETSGGSVWYNGKDMWTYSPSTKETTLVKPTKGELAEANPLTVLSSSSSNFKASFAPKQTKGRSTIVLSPTTRSGVKRVIVVLDSTSLKPVKIDVTMSDGNHTILIIKSLSTNTSHPDATFTYPAKKYPKIKVVDLR